MKDHNGAAVPVSIPVSMEKLEAIEARAGLSRNGLASAVLLLAMAAESHEDNVIMGWVYHQRTDMNKKQAIGLLISQLPVGVTMSELTTLSDLYEEIQRKVNAGMANSIYEWCLNNAVSFDDDMMLLVYEGNMFDWGEIAEIGARPVSLASQFGASETEVSNIRKMFTMATEDQQGIRMNLTYLKNAYTEEHIAQLRKLIDRYAKLVFSEVDPKTIRIKDILLP